MRKKKVVLIIIVLLILGVGFFVFLTGPKSLSDAQKEKELTKILGRAPNLNGKYVKQGDILHQGKYMSFYYPANSTIYHLQVNGEEVPDKGASEFFEFDMEEPRLLAVTEVIAGNTNIQSVTDYPSVRLRQSQPDIYKQSAIKADNQNGLEFDKKDSTGYERSAFFYVNGRIYSFSVQSANISLLTQVFNKIMLTVEFL